MIYSNPFRSAANMDVGPCRSCVRPGTIAQRSKTTVSGLLELPECVLLLILSHLGIKSRAAARLACRALRNALTGQQSVTIQLPDWYSAKVCVSPRVLGLLHAHRSNLARLEVVEQEEKLASEPPFYSDGRFRFWLQSQLLANVARDVSFLRVLSSWCHGAPEGNEMNNSTFVASGQLHAALSRMPRLESLHVDVTLDNPAVAELVDLPLLSRIELVVLPQQDVIQRLCQMQALTRLNLGLDREGALGWGAWDEGEVPEGVRSAED